MGSAARRVGAATLVVLALLVMGACGATDGAGSVAGASSSTTPEGPAAQGSLSYLAKVDANGLLDGLTYSQFFGRKMYDCMVAAGWTSLKLGDDGSLGGDVPPEQESAYDAAGRKCNAQVQAQFPTPPMSERAIRERFGYEVQTRTCLMALGYQISEPPSVDVFVQQFKASAPDLWLPYGQLILAGTLKPGELAALRAKCPDPSNRFYKP